MIRTLKTAITRRVGPILQRRVTRGVWTALGTLRSELYVQRLHRAGVVRAAALGSRAPLRLNLGCGFERKAGWVNVDLIDGVDLQLDLRERLPFAEGSVAAIYSSHLFEHLGLVGAGDSLGTVIETAADPSDALTFLRECRRVLTPDGRLDLVVPDAEVAIERYREDRAAGATTDPNWWGPSWCGTPMHRLNYVFRQGHEHKYAYDYETLRNVLETAGFVDINRRAFDPVVDHRNPARSIFVSARKPNAAARAA